MKFNADDITPEIDDDENFSAAPKKVQKKKAF